MKTKSHLCRAPIRDQADCNEIAVHLLRYRVSRWLLLAAPERVLAWAMETSRCGAGSLIARHVEEES
jgi:hypothetical protein